MENLNFKKAGVLLVYPLGYLFLKLLDVSDELGLFAPLILALCFIGVNELVRRGRGGCRITKLPKDSQYRTFFWYGMLILMAVTSTLAPYYGLTVFLMQFCAVYGVLVSGDTLLGGETGKFFGFDMILGLTEKPFGNFGQLVKDFSVFGKKSEKKQSNTLLTLAVVIIMGVLFIIAIGLLASSSGEFADLLDEAAEAIFSHIKISGSVMEVVMRLIIAVPIAAYFYGLMTSSAESDTRKLHAQGARIELAFIRLRGLAPVIINIAVALFVALYLFFFVFEGPYIFGAVTGRVPEGYLVSTYAREGFFELILITVLNMLVLLAAKTFEIRGDSGELRKSSKILCTVLMAESIIFSAVSLSKLGLYYSIYGYTEKRVLAIWAAAVMGFASVMAICDLFRNNRNSSRNPTRIWITASSVSYIVMCVVNGLIR